MLMTNQSSIQEVLFFPQMKPENQAKGELTRTEGSSNKAVPLTEDEKLVLDLLKQNSPVDLNELKDRTGLSNKKWDAAIKGLRKHNLAKVEKMEEGLFLELA
jgi:lysyl-tRNA synthetase class 2